VSPVLTITALLSHRQPFVAPLHRKEEADRAKRRLACGEASDHRAFLEAYDRWADACARGGAKAGGEFCWRNFLNGSSLRMVRDMRGQFADLLRDAGLLRPDGGGGEQAGGGGGGGEQAGGGGGRDVERAERAFLDAVCAALIEADGCSGLEPAREQRHPGYGR